MVYVFGVGLAVSDDATRVARKQMRCARDIIHIYKFGIWSALNAARVISELHLNFTIYLHLALVVSVVQQWQ